MRTARATPKSRPKCLVVHFLKITGPPRCGIEKTKHKCPWPRGEVEITLSTLGSLVILKSGAPEGGGPCCRPGERAPFKHGTCTHAHTLRTPEPQRHRDQAHRANCSQRTKGRRHRASDAPFPVLIHMARALCSLLILCTRPKARVCSTRAA